MFGNLELAGVDELSNDFDKYLQIVKDGREVSMTQDLKQIGRFVPLNTVMSSLTESLTGFFKSDADSDVDLDNERDERHEYFKEKYGLTEIMTGGL